jgi:hypothetical protein
MATYYNIPLHEMHAFLTEQGFKPVTLEGTVEAVYGKRVDQGNKYLTLRVYTGINPDGKSRSVGKDAIRVALFVWVKDRAVHVGGDKRVHRVEGWKVNLTKRLNSWAEGLPDHDCPKCHRPLTIRDGKNGKFIGCSGYFFKVGNEPSCKYSEPFPKTVNEGISHADLRDTQRHPRNEVRQVSVAIRSRRRRSVVQQSRGIPVRDLLPHRCL